MTGRAWPVVSAAGSVLIVVGILADSAPVLGVALALLFVALLVGLVAAARKRGR
ncbi:MAG: hypothetical protein ACRDT0_02105 [Pseudonocardiaceae bacterium]